MKQVSIPGGTQAFAASRSRDFVVIDGGDRYWKRLTERANMAYSQGEISLARGIYGDALAEGERLFTAALEKPCHYPAPVIYNVSCHNLAELENGEGNQQEAEGLYRRAYERLLEAARSSSSPMAMRVACVQHLKQALAALAHHLRSRGRDDGVIDRAVQEAYGTAFAVFRAARHAEQAGDDCPHCPIIPS
ncbi:hypothetical protein [Agrobacterium sp. 22-226-1]